LRQNHHIPRPAGAHRGQDCCAYRQSVPMDTRSSSATRLAQPPTSSSSFSTGGVSDRVSRLISYQRSGRVIFEVAQCPSADLHPMIIRPTLAAVDAAMASRTGRRPLSRASAPVTGTRDVRSGAPPLCRIYVTYLRSHAQRHAELFLRIKMSQSKAASISRLWPELLTAWRFVRAASAEPDALATAAEHRSRCHAAIESGCDGNFCAASYLDHQNRTSA